MEVPKAATIDSVATLFVKLAALTEVTGSIPPGPGTISMAPVITVRCPPSLMMISRIPIGAPGLIEVFETDGMRRVEVTRTEMGAHTLGFDQGHHIIYAFLPDSHRALVLHDRG